MKEILEIINADNLRTLEEIMRQEFEENVSLLDEIKFLCLVEAAKFREDSLIYSYDATDEKIVKELEKSMSELEELGFSVSFDGDEGNEYMLVSWH